MATGAAASGFNNIERSGMDLGGSELQRYPATLLLYALGLGAVEADRLRFLKYMLATTLRRKHQRDVPAVEILPPSCLFPDLERVTQMHKTLRPYAERIIPDNDQYTFIFDKLEILMALSSAHHRDEWSPVSYWVPLGPFENRLENSVPILREMEESLSAKGNESPFVTSGVFGETAANCKQGLEALKKKIL